MIVLSETIREHIDPKPRDRKCYCYVDESVCDAKFIGRKNQNSTTTNTTSYIKNLDEDVLANTDYKFEDGKRARLNIVSKKFTSGEWYTIQEIMYAFNIVRDTAIKYCKELGITAYDATTGKMIKVKRGGRKVENEYTIIYLDKPLNQGGKQITYERHLMNIEKVQMDRLKERERTSNSKSDRKTVK